MRRHRELGGRNDASAAVSCVNKTRRYDKAYPYPQIVDCLEAKHIRKSVTAIASLSVAAPALIIALFLIASSDASAQNVEEAPSDLRVQASGLASSGNISGFQRLIATFPLYQADLIAAALVGVARHHPDTPDSSGETKSGDSASDNELKQKLTEIVEVADSAKPGLAAIVSAVARIVGAAREPLLDRQLAAVIDTMIDLGATPQSIILVAAQTSVAQVGAVVQLTRIATALAVSRGAEPIEVVLTAATTTKATFPVVAGATLAEPKKAARLVANLVSRAPHLVEGIVGGAASAAPTAARRFVKAAIETDPALANRAVLAAIAAAPASTQFIVRTAVECLLNGLDGQTSARQIAALLAGVVNAAALVAPDQVADIALSAGGVVPQDDAEAFMTILIAIAQAAIAGAEEPRNPQQANNSAGFEVAASLALLIANDEQAKALSLAIADATRAIDNAETFLGAIEVSALEAPLDTSAIETASINPNAATRLTTPEFLDAAAAFGEQPSAAVQTQGSPN